MSGADTTEIHDRIVDLYKLPLEHRTLGGSGPHLASKDVAPSVPLARLGSLGCCL